MVNRFCPDPGFDEMFSCGDVYLEKIFDFEQMPVKHYDLVGQE